MKKYFYIVLFNGGSEKLVTQSELTKMEKQVEKFDGIIPFAVIHMIEEKDIIKFIKKCSTLITKPDQTKG